MQSNAEQAEAGPSSKPMTATSSSSSAQTARTDRLFVGNLSPTVDEYTLLQIFSKYGKITKLDFMFHKTGVLKGKPRGYAFIEFSNKDDAAKALTKLHDRLLRGRKLVVTSASSAPVSEIPYSNKGRRHTDPPKTTTLSLLKQKRHGQNTTAQIAAMEAKLAAMARTKPTDEDYIPGSLAYPLTGSASASASASPAPYESEQYDSEDGPSLERLSEPGITKEEAEQAAEELEKEFAAAVREDGPGRRDAGHQSSPKVSSPLRPSKADFATSTSGPTVGGLPARPRPQPPVRSEADKRKGTREEMFKKGLAGLPPKPAF